MQKRLFVGKPKIGETKKRSQQASNFLGPLHYNRTHNTKVPSIGTQSGVDQI
jgi:hypothetical protein